MQHKVQVVVAILLWSALHASAARNLLANGEMEGADEQKLPTGWEVVTIGTPASAGIDRSERHGGGASIRIVAAEKTRSYVQSKDAIAVAPGETILASAWVKVKDVPTDGGAVIMIADFEDAAGKNSSVAKFNVADLTKQGEWQFIEGSVKVPPAAAALRVRLGFSYSQGTCWWDDVTVTAEREMVCRIDLPDARLSPARATIPVAILNRDKRQGAVDVRVTLNGVKSDRNVMLTGEAMQVIEVPVRIGNPGKAALSAELIGEGVERFVDARQMTIPPPIALSPPAPTHWAVEDGPATVEAWVDLAVRDKQREGATLELRVEDGAGEIRGSATASDLSDGTTHLTVKTEALVEGRYRLVAELRPAGLRAERPFVVIPRRLARVTLDDAGFPVHDGKAIFPLGIFNGARFKEQADAGFTVTHAYNATRLESGWTTADAAALEFFDKTQAHGMKVMFQVPMKQVIAGDWEAVRRRVRTFRNHPALLAWCEEEGFARGDFKPQTLRTLRKLLQEEDPNHPFMVGDSKTVITRVPKDRSDFFPTGEMDMGMWWWYPIPLRPAGAADALEGDEGMPGMELVPPAFLVNARIKQPIWVGLQAYKKKNGRYPTPAEYRAQAFIAIAHGAKGLMWYGGSVTGGLYLQPDEGNWSGLQSLVRELHGMQTFLMAPSRETPKVLPANSPISVCLKDANGKLLLIAVNRSASSKLDATISSPLLPDGAVQHAFEPLGVLVREITSSSERTPGH